MYALLAAASGETVVARLNIHRRPSPSAPVTEHVLPSWAAIEAESRRMALAATPAELHGAVCGWLAGGGTDQPDWLRRVLANETIATPGEDSALQALRLASAEQIADRGFDFELLLPEADASLAERSGALFDWCRGFLGGFGLAAGANPPLSEESREALADLAKLAGAQAQDEGDEEDEEALMEIQEFVRVAVLLLHGDCVLAPQHRGRLN